MVFLDAGTAREQGILVILPARQHPQVGIHAGVAFAEEVGAGIEDVLQDVEVGIEIAGRRRLDTRIGALLVLIRPRR